jgi:predicted CXXCH cytochrome family protein
MKATSLKQILKLLLILHMRPDNDVSAFHDGGVGPCDACHSMHNPSQSAGGSLLKSADPSSTCLNCHEQTGDTGPASYHVSTAQSDMPPGAPPKQLSPGGDFGWLKKTFTWVPSATGILQMSLGDRHGHNIIANNFQYAADSTNGMAPEGTYPAMSLTCISCHDPHGKYRRDTNGTISASGTAIQGSGSYASSADPQSGLSVGVYRLLGGKNYQPKYLSGNFSFINDPPAAVAPDTYNRAESGTQTRVAYGSNMSEWCQNCHTTMHTIVSSGTSSTTPQTHPVGSLAKFGSTLSTNYNMYVKTGVLTGIVNTSFLSLVPFEEGISDYPTLKAHARSDDSYLYGPDSTNSQVMCLTCHRAHASAWDYATRWNTNSDYIVYNGFYSQDGQAYQPYGQGRTEMEAQKAYYDMQAGRFALNQDTLCHKCHVGALP